MNLTLVHIPHTSSQLLKQLHIMTYILVNSSLTSLFINKQLVNYVKGQLLTSDVYHRGWIEDKSLDGIVFLEAGILSYCLPDKLVLSAK